MSAKFAAMRAHEPGNRADKQIKHPGVCGFCDRQDECEDDGADADDDHDQLLVHSCPGVEHFERAEFEHQSFAGSMEIEEKKGRVDGDITDPIDEH